MDQDIIKLMCHSKEDMERLEKIKSYTGYLTPVDIINEYYETDNKLAEKSMTKAKASKVSSLKRSLTCKLCINAAVSQVYFPCAHAVCCNPCGCELSMCPVCRGCIKGIAAVKI